MCRAAFGIEMANQFVDYRRIAVKGITALEQIGRFTIRVFVQVTLPSSSSSSTNVKVPGSAEIEISLVLSITVFCLFRIRTIVFLVVILSCWIDWRKEVQLLEKTIEI